MTSKFDVNYNSEADELQGKTVLVFLKPQNPQRNYMVHAWQVLTGSAGATESFDYEAGIPADVTDIGVHILPIVSGRQRLLPGQLLSELPLSGLSSRLQAEAASLMQTKLTPQQGAVLNETFPDTQLVCAPQAGGEADLHRPELTGHGASPDADHGCSDQSRADPQPGPVDFRVRHAVVPAGPAIAAILRRSTT